MERVFSRVAIFAVALMAALCLYISFSSFREGKYQSAFPPSRQAKAAWAAL
jgi:hypothetical protein